MYLLLNIPKRDITWFAIYDSHYKEKSEMIEFIYNFFISGYYQSCYHYLVSYLTILSNLLLITCITKNISK